MSLSAWCLLAADANPVGSGRIQGGWEYVWGAYAVTWTLLVLYALSLWLRQPKADDSKSST